jgi:hypothetical protein
VMSSATMVATVRSLVRDTIVDFVIKLAQWAIPAVASAVATVGASLAPIIAGAVASAVQTASKIAELISKLLKHLDDAGLAMGKIASSVEQIATGLANKANGVRQAGDAVADGFRQLSTGEVPAALRGGRPLPEWLGGGPNSTRINLDLPGSPGEAVRRFNEDLLSPQTGAKVILEPHKQNGAEIRDENNWREEDRK